jgi:hypothetical protein
VDVVYEDRRSASHVDCAKLPRPSVSSVSIPVVGSIRYPRGVEEKGGIWNCSCCA